MLVDEDADTVDFAMVVADFAVVATGAGVTACVFVSGAAGDVGNTDFAGTVSAAGFARAVSTVFAPLAVLPTAVVGAEAAVAATGGGVGIVVSIAGGFPEATDAAGSGQRWP